MGVQAQAAHVFMISEEAEPVETVVVELIQGNAKEPVKLAEDAKVKALCGQGGPPCGRPRHDRRASSAADLERHD